MLTFNYSNKDYRICFQHWTEKRLSAEIENSNILLPNPGRPSKAITNCILQALSTVTDAWFAAELLAVEKFGSKKLIVWKMRLLQYRSGEIMQPESGVKKRYCGEKSELDRL